MFAVFFFSSRRRHTRFKCDWSSDVCSSDLFPSVTISYNLLPGTSLGEAVASIQQVEKGLGKPLSLQTSFQGNGQAYLQSIKSTPLLILAALVVIYLILAILYESIIHPLTTIP